MSLVHNFGIVLDSFAIIASLAGWLSVPQSQDKFLIANVRLFDGEKVVPSASVLVENGKIEAVGKTVAVPLNAQVIDGAGKTLIPGLIDAHVHVWSREGLAQAVVFGVTSVVDMFTGVDFAAGVRKAQAEGVIAPPQAFLVSCGTLVTVAGGHGTEYGLKIPTLENAASAQAFVDARIAEGADFIKIIYDDGHAYGMSIPTLSLNELAAVIKAAHVRHKLAVVHCGSLKMCEEALRAGADGLAHLIFDDVSDPAFGKLAASRKAFVIPTLTVLASMNQRSDAAGLAKDERLAPYLKEADLQSLKGVPPFATGAGAYAAAARTLRQLREAGVTILAGTDTSNPGTAFGASLHGELALLVAAGLTPIEALRAATSVPARTFGIRGRGRIRTGAWADLVLVEGDPTVDIKATRAIAAVWKDGVRVDREAFAKEAARDRAAVENQAAAPAGLADGLISDFEGEGDKITAKFGAGWVPSTDAIRGGRSTVALSLVQDGAEGSARSLLVKGTLSDAAMVRWAGAMFIPGSMMMAPADLSSKKVLSFRVKGLGPGFSVMMFVKSAGFMPRIQTFPVSDDWREIVLPFEKFGTDGRDIMGILICASGKPGDFAFQVDDVRLR
ncbi:MAG: amidohydrolase family protein [Candidatus Aminicenantales bacterium]